MHDGQLARHGQHGAFAGRVSQLRRCAAEERDHAGGVNNATAFFTVFSEREHGVLGAEPDAFDVYIVREIPNSLYEWWTLAFGYWRGGSKGDQGGGED